MGSSLKGSNSQRVPYALMLLLAFGAAILGVMVLHKLREKRIFNVLVKQKEHELLTLHLLFQREKEFNKEARKKIEEMKTKFHSLRSEKLEVDRRLLEMESTVSSLRDERKVIESAFEEKKNEIKKLMEGRMKNSSSEYLLHVASLKETIKTKEAEIEDLKLQQERVVKGSTNSNSTNDEHESQAETVILRETKPDKLNEAEGGAAGTQSDMKIEIAENGDPPIRTDEIIEGEMGNAQRNQGLKEGHEGEPKRGENERSEATDVFDDARNEESQAYSSFHGGGHKLEKSNGSDSEQGIGSRERRKRSKGKRWIEIMEKRRFGHSQVRNEEPQKEGKGKHIGNIEGNKKQKPDEIISKQSEEQETSGKPEKMQSIDVNKHENDNEHKEVEKEEVEAEDMEDAETREPEIDKADIQRFSESDRDDENEETEF